MLLLKSCIIVAVCFIVYWRILGYEYIIDDQLVPKKKGKWFLHTFWLQLTASGYSNRYVEHFQRILVHSIVCVVMYFAFGKNDVSFVAALLFAVNPINNQAVAWLNGIGYSMSALLVLLMMMFPVCAGIFYFSTLWWHLTAFPAPLLFIPLGIPYMAALLPAYILMCWLHGFKVPFRKVQKNATALNRWTVGTGMLYRKVYLMKFIFVFKPYAYYFFLTLMPKRIGLYHTFGYAFALTERDTEKWLVRTPLFYAGIITAVVNLMLIILFWGTPLSFGLCWYNIFIAQWCNVIILHQPIAERYCYLPAIGLMYALSWSIFKIGEVLV